MKGRNNVVQFKQTYIKSYLYIRMRDFDKKWEVIMRINDPRYNYDETWKGGVTVNKQIIQPQAWVTQFVCDTRDEALLKAKTLIKDKTLVA